MIVYQESTYALVLMDKLVANEAVFELQTQIIHVTDASFDLCSTLVLQPI